MVKDKKRSFKELLPIVVKQLNEEKVDNCIDHVMELYENYT